MKRRIHIPAVSRRAFLGIAGATAAGLAVPSLGGSSISQAAGQAPATKSVRWESVPDAHTGESAVFRAPFAMTAAGILWSGSAPGLAVRTGKEGRWKDWTPVHVHDGEGRGKDTDLQHGSLIPASGDTEIQYRVSAATGVQRVICELIDSSGPSQAASMRKLSTPRFFSRADWGADESLRFEGGEEMWPVETKTVEKVVAHHTVTANDDNDPAATIRSIYYYHCKTLGWGDIGYNLLIDAEGNVYEGRFGGPQAIGAHTAGFNTGSAGIAFLGNYGERYISTAAEQAFAQIVAARYPAILPWGSGFFNSKNLMNICGHRDCISTECPGNLGYQQLANLRDSVARNEGRPRQQVQLIGAAYGSVDWAYDVVKVSINVWNNSTRRIETQGPDPGTTYGEYENSGTVGHPGIVGRWRVGVDFLDQNTGKVYPYRWGLGAGMDPGEQRTVTGIIDLDGGRPNTWWWAGLIEEGAAFRADHVAVARMAAPSVQRSFYIPLSGRYWSADDGSEALRAR